MSLEQYRTKKHKLYMYSLSWRYSSCMCEGSVSTVDFRSCDSSLLMFLGNKQHHRSRMFFYGCTFLHHRTTSTSGWEIRQGENHLSVLWRRTEQSEKTLEGHHRQDTENPPGDCKPGLQQESAVNSQLDGLDCKSQSCVNYKSWEAEHTGERRVEADVTVLEKPR